MFQMVGKWRSFEEPCPEKRAHSIQRDRAAVVAPHPARVDLGPRAPVPHGPGPQVKNSHSDVEGIFYYYFFGGGTKGLPFFSLLVEFKGGNPVPNKK